ncbi:MAG: hypothetical protein ACK2TV_08255, partial [Anaerolineales bacterium]
GKAVPKKMIQTTLGPISPVSLGKVDVHEHIVIDRSKNEIIPEDFHHVEVDLITADLMDWKTVGGGAIIDSSPIGAGRNIRLLTDVSDAAKVPLIISTGFHKLSYYHETHWLFSSSAEDLYETLYGECTLGVLVDDRHPKESQRSSSKANMLKMGLDHRGVTAVIERIMTAIGEVSRQTGIPCMIHTEPEVPFHEVVEALKQAEIPPERVIFCHMGKSFDLTLHEALAKDGYYLEFDEMVRPEPSLEILAQGILNLFAQGFGSSILFAGDLARRSYWNCYGGKPGLAYLLTGLENNLLSLGLSQAMLDQIWLNNPRELFL